jgi:hypothetical protein
LVQYFAGIAERRNTATNASQSVGRQRMCKMDHEPPDDVGEWIAEEGRKSRQRALIAALAGVAWFAFMAWVYFCW